MRYEAIVKCFGEPSGDLGSGIHIYVYRLNDLTQVWIGFTDVILYARHMSPDSKLLEVFI